jgi:NAD(P)-dependent dehydrogenase (short-subunit alcohol dehydrogenase family)
MIEGREGKTMDLALRGKRVFVTAGASGIGRAIATAFTAEGARVHVCDIDRAALDALPQWSAP